MENSERTQVVIDETTIYEIDLECLGCSENKSRLDPLSEKRTTRTDKEEK